MYTDNFTQVLENISGTFVSFWDVVGEYFLKIALAVGLIIIGWIVGNILKKFIKSIIKKADFDKFFAKFDLDSFLEKMGFKLNLGKFVGDIVKWVVFIGFFTASLKILEFDVVLSFMIGILGIIINLVVAIMIFFVAVVTGRFVKNISEGVSKAMKIECSNFIGRLASFVVYFLALITILGLFDVTRVILNFVEIIIIGIVVAFSVAFGLAFGLGGKERAKEILENMKK